MDNLVDYSALDVAILEAIANGHREMGDLKEGAVKREALKIVSATRSGLSYRRIVQRRLQAMRAAGRIGYTRRSKSSPDGGWAVIPKEKKSDESPVAIDKTFGRVAHDAVARAGGWSPRWQHMSNEQKQQWEAIASAVIEAYEKRRVTA